jgi:hypothetical protein
LDTGNWLVDMVNGQGRFPRVYVSDSSLFTRLTDVIRMVNGADEAIFKGYRQVTSINST